MKVCWISAGVSSFIAGWLARDTVNEYIYIDISDQHPDSMRFIKDCEKALGKPIQILRSEQYSNVMQCLRSHLTTIISGHYHCMKTGFGITGWMSADGMIRLGWGQSRIGCRCQNRQRRANDEID